MKGNRRRHDEGRRRGGGAGEGRDGGTFGLEGKEEVMVEGEKKGRRLSFEDRLNRGFFTLAEFYLDLLCNREGEFS